MIGYIIGVVLGVIIFLFENLKPTSIGFRVMYLLTSIGFLLGIFFAHLGYKNLFIIPLGELVLCFISAFCFPYDGKSALTEYKVTNGENYYANLHDKDKIGRIEVPGFKQTYDRIMGGIITQLVTNPDELQKMGNLIYSKNFYPISIHTKEEVLQHLNTCIDEVAKSSKYGKTIRIEANKNIAIIFNTYVSVMSIHEEATREIEEIMKKRQEEDWGQNF